MIEVLETAALNSVQDLGRKGQRRFGIGRAGAMDSLAMATGNLLVGNEPGSAGIEVQFFPLRLKFHADTVVAVTGADCRARVDDMWLPPWWAVAVKAGQELTMLPPSKGLRSYVLVSGGFDVPVVMGSRSTSFRLRAGGHEGRELRRGDRIPIAPAARMRIRDKAGFGILPPHDALPLPADGAAEGAIVVRAMPSSEYEDFHASSQHALWNGSWVVTTQSNRMGYRLKGEPLQRQDALELRSRGIVPGVVQVPPGGQPIIQLADGNSAGGYPQIACVIEADLWRLAQATPGTLLRFRCCDIDEARNAGFEAQAYLDRLRHEVRYCNGTL